MGSPFQAALEDRDLAGLRACAQADLHMHTGVVSGDREFLKERTGLDIRPLDRALASMDDMHAWVRSQVGDGFSRMPGRLIGVQATFVQARRDGVTRLEDHPIRQLVDAGVRVTVGTDDPLVFGTSLSGDSWAERHTFG